MQVDIFLSQITIPCKYQDNKDIRDVKSKVKRVHNLSPDRHQEGR